MLSRRGGAVAALLLAACSSEAETAATGGPGGAGGGGQGGAATAMYHVVLEGHGTVTIGATELSCDVASCEQDLTLTAPGGVELTMRGTAPDWVVDALEVDGQSIGNTAFPLAGTAALEPGDHDVVARFRELPACAAVPDRPDPPVIDVVWQGDSLVGTQLLADVCRGGGSSLSGSDLTEPSFPVAACVTIGAELVTQYADTGTPDTDLTFVIPTAAIEGPALLVVRNTAGRAMTMVEVVDLPPPNPSTVTPQSGPPGATFTIAGTAMERVISVSYSPNFGDFFIGPITATATTPTTATFEVPNDPPGSYTLHWVHNACADSTQELNIAFTIE